MTIIFFMPSLKSVVLLERSFFTRYIQSGFNDYQKNSLVVSLKDYKKNSFVLTRHISKNKSIINSFDEYLITIMGNYGC